MVAVPGDDDRSRQPIRGRYDDDVDRAGPFSDGGAKNRGRTCRHDVAIGAQRGIDDAVHGRVASTVARCRFCDDDGRDDEPRAGD
jgi:hypothetical protein